MSAGTTPRLLRLSISLYRSPSRNGAEAYDFATNNHAVQAAKIHAKHGIHSYVQVDPFPLPLISESHLHLTPAH